MKSNLLVAEEDYNTLIGYVRGVVPSNGFDRQNALVLEEELKKAKLMKKAELPKDVVQLNSKVIVKEDKKEKEMQLVLVLPPHADVKLGRISVFAPIGTALLGFRQGQHVKWQLPSGTKKFTILSVED